MAESDSSVASRTRARRASSADPNAQALAAPAQAAAAQAAVAQAAPAQAAAAQAAAAQHALPEDVPDDAGDEGGDEIVSLGLFKRQHCVYP